MSALRRMAFFVAALAAACAPSLGAAPDDLIACSGPEDCPPGWDCREALALCVDSSIADGTPPTFVAGPLVTPRRLSRVPGFDELAVTFTLSEDVGVGTARLRVALGQQELACTGEPSGAGVAVACRYQVGPRDVTGRATIAIRAVDLGGNLLEAAEDVDFDFSPPEVTGVLLVYVPAPDQPLPTPTRAAPGTTIELTVTADSPLDVTATPELRATAGSSELLFTTEAVDGAVARFSCVVPAEADDGVYTPILAWSDASGNRAENATFAEPAIRIDGTPPALVVAQEQLTYVRSPWGQDADEMFGEHVVPAGPYFALAPGEGLSTLPRLAADTFTLDDGEAPAVVRLWPELERINLLATLSAAPDGSWPRQRLPAVDVPVLYATGVDAAGNESEPVAIQRVESIATARSHILRPNPHRLTSLGSATALRDPDPDASRTVDAGAEAIDAEAVSARGGPRWRALGLPGERSPRPRFAHALAYDVNRGRVVLFGGSPTQTFSDFLADTWEWSGAGWAEHTPLSGANPTARISHRLVYDGAGGGVLLLGGVQEIGWPVELEEWDGEAWRPSPNLGVAPPARAGMGAAWDVARGRLVMFGGHDTEFVAQAGTWEWDGATWYEPGPSPEPLPRLRMGFAYDELRAVTVLYGGCLDTTCASFSSEVWEWDGEAWLPRDDAPMGPRGAVAMTAFAGGVVAFGGIMTPERIRQKDLWFYDGTSWQLLDDGAGLAVLLSTDLVWDRASDELLLFATTADAAAPYTLTYRLGAGWQVRPAAPAGPPPRESSTVAFDSSRGRLLAYGGWDFEIGQPSSDLWEWDGAAWDRRCDANPLTDICEVVPPGGQALGMAYDSARNVTVLYGGCANQDCSVGYDQLWEWDGAAWAQRCDGEPVDDVCPLLPPVTAGGSLAFDPGAGVTTFVAFNPGAGARARAWEWDGVAWSERCDGDPLGDVCAERPPARSFASLAHDATGDRMILFGGITATSGGITVFLGDTWALDEGGWTALAGGPPARGFAAMADDPTLGLVLFGGVDDPRAATNPFIDFRADVWLWRDGVWSEHSPQVSAPRGRRGAKLAYDTVAGRVLLFGGFESFPTSDLWELDAASDRHATIQLDVSADLGPVTSQQLDAVTVRARCAGDGAGSGAPGAALWLWRAGRWVQVAANSAAGDAAGQAAADLTWSSPSAREAQLVVTGLTRKLAVQCRAVGADSGDAESTVSMDYVEARLRYLTE